MCSHHDPFSPLPLELGAEFLQGRPPVLDQAIKGAKIRLIELDGKHYCFDKPKLAECNNDWDAVFALIGKTQPQDRDFKSRLRDACKSRELTDREAALAASFVEGYHATRLDDISVHSIAAQEKSEEEAGGNALLRAADGYDQVIQWLAAPLAGDPQRIRLNRIVAGIDWTRPTVRVTARMPAGLHAEVHAAPRVIVTLPLGVLKQAARSRGAIRFTPGLPAPVRVAFENLMPGAVAKMTLRFRAPFWEGGRAGRKSVQRMSFLHARGHPFPTWWTTHPLESGQITAWAGGPAAERLVGKGEAAWLRAALTTLANVFGLPRTDLEGALEDWRAHDWHVDPFALGAYSHVRPGGMESQRALAQPIGNRIYFAGEALSESDVGTVHGAMQSGIAAARRLVADAREA